MSLLTAAARWMVRWLPDKDLDVIQRELAHRTAPASVPEQSQHQTSSDGPDWPYVWSALLEAAGHASRIEDLLSDEQVFFDFGQITRAADDLRGQIFQAHKVMCRAPLFDGLDLDAGDSLNSVRHLIGVRRAEIIDAELATMQWSPAPANGRAWSIDYRKHGGFIATSQPGDGTQPWRFWGTARTARSAEHLLHWYFVDQPPTTVTFDPPQPTRPRPIAAMGLDADLSCEGPAISDLLDMRGPIYDQHIAACTAPREALNVHGGISAYLSKRAAELNATDPLLPNQAVLAQLRHPLNPDHRASADTVQWVPTHLVVGTHHTTWGNFGGFRDDAPQQIAAGLLESDLDTFTRELFMDTIYLVRSPGWAGPLYCIGDNGNHRIHTARMLKLPWIAAAITTEAPATSWDMSSLILTSSDSYCDKESEDRHAELVAGLIRRGIIDGELAYDRGQPQLHCQRLPATWLLRAPHHTTKVNAVYESRYPGALERLGIPVAVGTDPETWTQWLTSS